MKIEYKIIAVKEDGTEFECFRWSRDPESGIQRAYSEAKERGIKIVHAYAQTFVE